MKEIVVRSLAWQGGATLLARGIRYIAVLVLARLLDPTTFGQFASIYVFIDGLHLIQGFGIAQAVIVRRERQEEGADTAFWLSLGIGVALAILAAPLAPAVAGFYRDPTLAWPFVALVAVLPLHALRVVPLRLFEREMNFRAKAGPTVAAAIAFVVVAVGAALAGLGLWAFVIAVLVAAAVETLAFWWISPYRPQRRFVRSIAREDLSFGIPIMLAGALTYLFNSSDRVFVGRFAGTAALGPYAFAYSLAALPVTFGAMVVSLVMVPSYAAMRDDAAMRRQVLARATRMTAGLAGGFAAVMIGLGGDGLRAAYGEKWIDAIAPLGILSIAAVFRALTAVVGDAFVGSGQAKAFRRVNLVQLIVVLPLLPLGLKVGGPPGVAAAIAIASLTALLEAWRMASVTLGVPARSLAGAAIRPAVAAATLAASILFVRDWLARPETLPAVASSLVVATVAFFAIWVSVDPAARRELAALPRARRTPRA